MAMGNDTVTTLTEKHTKCKLYNKISASVYDVLITLKSHSEYIFVSYGHLILMTPTYTKQFVVQSVCIMNISVY